MTNTNEAIISSIQKIIGVSKPVTNSGSLALVNGYVTGVDNADIGTIDMVSRDGSIVVRGASLSAMYTSSRGFLVKPTINSDVVVLLLDEGQAYVVSFSHVDEMLLESDVKTYIGSSGYKPQNDTTDYDEVEATGYATCTQYTPEEISQISKYNDSFSKITSTYKAIKHQVGDKTFTEISETSVKLTSNSTFFEVKDGKIVATGSQIILGDENGKLEKAVLGDTLNQVLSAFIDAVASITTVTSLGTQPIMNMAQVQALKSQLPQILSQVNKLQ